MNKKSKGIGIILILLLGSFGVFYASVKWGWITTLLFPIIEVVVIAGFFALSPESGILSIFTLALIHIAVCIAISNDEIDAHNRAVNKIIKRRELGL